MKDCTHPKGIASGHCFEPTCENFLYVDNKYQFQCVGGEGIDAIHYEATYDGGYAKIEYMYHKSARVLFATGINVPDEEDLLAEFIDWVW